MKGTPRAESRCPREEINQGLWESQRFRMDQAGSWPSLEAEEFCRPRPATQSLSLPGARLP